MVKVQSWMTFGLTSLKIGGKSRDESFNEVAYMQWSRNSYFAYRKKLPPKVMQAFLNFWEASGSNEDAWEKHFNELMNLR